VSEEAQRLPLWRNFCERIVAAGLVENQTFTTELIARELSAHPASAQFAFAVHEIRRYLRRKGWVLSARGQNGTQYVILPRSRNADEMQRHQKRAITALREGVILGTQTPLDTLNAEDRRRHEAILEKLALKSVLIKRAGNVVRFLAKHKSKLLPPAAEKSA